MTTAQNILSIAKKYIGTTEANGGHRRTMTTKMPVRAEADLKGTTNRLHLQHEGFVDEGERQFEQGGRPLAQLAGGQRAVALIDRLRQHVLHTRGLPYQLGPQKLLPVLMAPAP